MAAKLTVATGYLKLTNVNSFVLKLTGGLEFTDSTKVFAANCGFAACPEDPTPGVELDPANVAGHVSLLNRFRAEILRDQIHPATLVLLLGCYAENIGFNAALNTAILLTYDAADTRMGCATTTFWTGDDLENDHPGTFFFLASLDLMLRFSQLFLAWSTSNAVYCP